MSVLEDLLCLQEGDLETQINVAETYALLREFLLVDLILQRLEKELSEKAKYTLEGLREAILSELRRRINEGGLFEAAVIEMYARMWKRDLAKATESKKEASRKITT